MTPHEWEPMEGQVREDPDGTAEQWECPLCGTRGTSWRPEGMVGPAEVRPGRMLRRGAWVDAPPTCGDAVAEIVMES